MTVSDIAHKIKINRNSVAKYLDILLILGHVQLVTFGPAKVYFPSKRIPTHTLMNYSTNGMILFDYQLTITEINETITKMLSLSREETLGISIKKHKIPPFHSEAIQSKIEQALEGNASESNLLITKGSAQLYIHIQHLPITFDNGEAGVACILNDQTELHTTKQQKTRYELETHSLMNLFQDILLIIDENYDILRINEAGKTILASHNNEIIGKKCYELFHKTETPPAYCPHKNAIQTQQSSHAIFYEPTLKKKLDVTIQPLLHQDGKLYGSLNIIRLIE